MNINKEKSKSVSRYSANNNQLKSLLKHYKNLELIGLRPYRSNVINRLSIKNETSKKSKPYACKYGYTCTRKNPQHFIEFSHPDGLLANLFSDFTEKFIYLSFTIYYENNHRFPNEWYTIISKYLKETDYTNYNSLYFNLLANLCLNAYHYSNQYKDRHFWSALFVGMEENAVTGMFNVSHIPDLEQSLRDIESPDTRFLSNTALLFSKPFKMLKK